MEIIPNIVGMELRLNKLIHYGLISLGAKCFVTLIIIFRATVAVSLDPVLESHLQMV